MNIIKVYNKCYLPENGRYIKSEEISQDKYSNRETTMQI